MDAPWYTGFLAHFGVLVWWAGAVVGLSGAALLARRESLRRSAALLILGGLSAVLSLDDLLRLHEGFLPDVLGIPKPVTYGAYAVVAVAWPIAFLDFVRRTEWWLLALAAVLLAASVAIDQLAPDPPPHLFEDGTKFLGIAVWTLYVVQTTYALVAPLHRVERDPAAPSEGDESRSPAR